MDREAMEKLERLFTEGVRDAADRIDMDPEQRKKKHENLKRQEDVLQNSQNTADRQ